MLNNFKNEPISGLVSMEGYWKKEIGNFFVVQTLQQRLLKDNTAPKHDKHAAKKPIITLETRFTQAQSYSNKENP